MEKELKKMKTYRWGRKQSNSWDNLTRFIYKITTYSDLMSECNKRFKNDQDLIEYTKCRFYNFHCHNAVQDIFEKYSEVRPEENKKHRTRDFYINGEPFDLKLSVYPKGLIGKVKTDKEIATWLYKNQSGQQRHHLKNRLFIIVLDDNDHDNNWKVKSNFKLIEKKIKEFMKDPEFITYEKSKCAVIRVIQGYDEQ